MNALNLYSIIEQDLDFKEEIKQLYDAYELLIDQLEPSSLLDIGCGQGDFLLQIKNENLKTFGIDISNEQIKICKQKNLNASCIDINEVNDKYELVSAVFDVLNYIPKDTLENFLNATYSVLNKDGYFILDVNSLFGFEEVAQGSLNINQDDKFIAIDAFFENEILKTNITLFQKQKNNTYTKEEDFICQYYHNKKYLENLLKKVGFKIQNIINFKLHDPMTPDKFIFICKK